MKNLINRGVGFGVGTFEEINRQGDGVVGGTNEVVTNEVEVVRLKFNHQF